MSDFTHSSDLREELRSATAEPLLPIEKKLIAWSLGIAAVSYFWARHLYNHRRAR